MKLRQLLDELQYFDRDFEVELEITTDCGHLITQAPVDHISCKDGVKIVLKGND